MQQYDVPMLTKKSIKIELKFYDNKIKLSRCDCTVMCIWHYYSKHMSIITSQYMENKNKEEKLVKVVKKLVKKKNSKKYKKLGKIDKI